MSTKSRLLIACLVFPTGYVLGKQSLPYTGNAMVSVALAITWTFVFSVTIDEIQHRQKEWQRPIMSIDRILTALFGLVILDSLTTAYIFTRWGLPDDNPLIRVAIESYGWELTMAVKILIAMIVIYYAHLAQVRITGRDRKLLRLGLFIATVVLFVVVGINTTLIMYLWSTPV